MDKRNKRPTITDVAAHAGVSISTVSRVLNNSAPVEDDKAEKVRQAIEALNYQPKAAARILASQRTETIGLLLPLISGEYFAGMLRGVERGVIEGGYDLLIHSTFTDVRPNSPYRGVLGEHNTDGLIVFSDSLDDQALARLAEMHIESAVVQEELRQGEALARQVAKEIAAQRLQSNVGDKLGVDVQTALEDGATQEPVTIPADEVQTPLR